MKNIINIDNKKRGEQNMTKVIAEDQEPLSVRLKRIKARSDAFQREHDEIYKHNVEEMQE